MADSPLDEKPPYEKPMRVGDNTRSARGKRKAPDDAPQHNEPKEDELKPARY